MLTINENLEIIKFIDAGSSYIVIAEEYGIAQSTVANFKKEDLVRFDQRFVNMRVEGRLLLVPVSYTHLTLPTIYSV